MQQKLGQPGGLVEATDQYPACERIQGAGVPDARGLEQVLDAGDRLGRGEPLGLVDDQDSVHMPTDQPVSCALISFRVDSSWNPAALRWPPPPNPPAQAATSTVPSERRLTW